MTNIVWQNTQIPGFGGALNAANQSVSNFNNIVDNFKQGQLDKADRKIAAEDRAFKRKDDLLQRDVTNQQIAQGLFEADNRQAKFDLAQDAVQARIGSSNANTNAANQRAQINAYTHNQTKKVQEDTDKMYKAFSDRMGNNPNNLTERQIQTGLTNFANENDIAPEAIESVFGSLGGRYANTSGETAIANEQDAIKKWENKVTMQKLENTGKVDAAIAKNSGKSAALVAGGLGDATIADAVTSSSTDEVSLNPFSGWDTDKESKASASAYAGNFKKALGKDYPSVVKKSIKNGHFDESTFNSEMKTVLQRRFK